MITQLAASVRPYSFASLPCDRFARYSYTNYYNSSLLSLTLHFLTYYVNCFDIFKIIFIIATKRLAEASLYSKNLLNCFSMNHLGHIINLLNNKQLNRYFYITRFIPYKLNFDCRIILAWHLIQ